MIRFVAFLKLMLNDPNNFIVVAFFLLMGQILGMARLSAPKVLIAFWGAMLAFPSLILILFSPQIDRSFAVIVMGYSLMMSYIGTILSKTKI